jgi:hypothetical protein
MICVFAGFGALFGALSEFEVAFALLEEGMASKHLQTSVKRTMDISIYKKERERER